MINTKDHFARIASLKERLMGIGETHDKEQFVHKKRQIENYVYNLLDTPLLSQQMFAFHQRVLDRFSRLLLGNWSDIESTTHNWGSKTQNEKIRTLKDFQIALAKIQTQESGIEVRPVRLLAADDNEKFYGLANGYYDVSSPVFDRVWLGRSPLRYFAQSLSVLAHEQTHILQFAMGRAVEFDTIDPVHPLYRDALVFHAMWSNDCYMDPRCGISHSLYKPQTVEKHARELQKMISRIFWPVDFIEKPRTELIEALRNNTYDNLPESAKILVTLPYQLVPQDKKPTANKKRNPEPRNLAHSPCACV